MSLHIARPEHEAAYQDVVALIGRHADKLTGLELLAVAGNIVGKMIAMQDQRTTTPEMAMEVVMKNLKHGNRQVVEQLMRAAAGGRA